MEKNRNLDEIIDLLSMILNPKDAIESGKKVVNDVKENVGEIVESVIENGKDVVNDVKENVGEIVESVIEIRSLDNIIDKLRYTYKDGISKYELEKIKTGIIASIFEKLDKIGFNENQQMLIKKYLEEQINEKIEILEKQINEGKQSQQKEIEEQNKKISFIEESFNVLQNDLKDHKIKLMDEKKKEQDLLTQELKKFEGNMNNVNKEEYEKKIEEYEKRMEEYEKKTREENKNRIMTAEKKLMDEKKKEQNLLIQELKKFEENNSIQIKRSNKKLNNKYLNESIKILTNPSLSNAKKRNLILELQHKYCY